MQILRSKVLIVTVAQQDVTLHECDGERGGTGQKSAQDQHAVAPGRYVWVSYGCTDAEKGPM